MKANDMNAITTQNPLMLAINHNGQTYFTSHYFHQQYRANKPEGGKYARQKDFMRLIRGIEAYPQYVERGDIVELERDKAGAEFAPAFRANFGNPIMLINATAQVALTHHLDDEINKQASVNVNAQAAERAQAKPKASLNPYREFRELFGIAKLIGFDKNAAAISANHAVIKQTGVNVLALLDAEQLSATNQESLAFTPTQLGSRIGLTGKVGERFNLLLEYAGLQALAGEVWIPTEKGKPHAWIIDTGKKHKSGAPVQQVKWYETVLPLVEAIRKGEPA